MISVNLVVIQFVKSVHNCLAHSQKLFQQATISSHFAITKATTAIKATIAATTNKIVPVTGHVATLKAITANVRVPKTLIIGPIIAKNPPNAPAIINIV